MYTDLVQLDVEGEDGRVVEVDVEPHAGLHVHDGRVVAGHQRDAQVALPGHGAAPSVRRQQPDLRPLPQVQHVQRVGLARGGRDGDLRLPLLGEGGGGKEWMSE